MAVRAAYLTVAVLTMAWTLGLHDDNARARAALERLGRWSGLLSATAGQEAWWSPRVAAAAPQAADLAAPDAVLLPPAEALAPSAGASAALPVAVPQPYPTPRPPSPTPAGSAATAGTEAPGGDGSPAVLPGPHDPLAHLADPRELGGARYEATLIMTPDGGLPSSLAVLYELGSTPPSLRLRVTFVGESGEEAVRLDEVQYGGAWYSFDAGEWTARDAAAPPDGAPWPDVTARLGKLAWLLEPALMLRPEGRQDLGVADWNGLPAHQYRFGPAAVRPEWLAAMDLPDVESGTVDVWLGEESRLLLAMEAEARCLTYAGKATLLARVALREQGAQVVVRRPSPCTEVALPPDVALPAAAEGASHECDSWTYRLAGNAAQVLQAHREALEPLGWHYAAEESYEPDYIVFRKGVRRVVVRVDAQEAGCYAVLSVVTPSD
ncbi:MAG: hypothetical protein GX657_06360 [Chloroflexi bacterium]|nr:hypothetical protein [Chloroflexota bacterium]